LQGFCNEAPAKWRARRFGQLLPHHQGACAGRGTRRRSHPWASNRRRFESGSFASASKEACPSRRIFGDPRRRCGARCCARS
jgi:hypothetical protein